jgi:hypothetical protein
VVAVSSIVVGIAVLVFAVNLWKHTAVGSAATQPIGTAAAG